MANKTLAAAFDCKDYARGMELEYWKNNWDQLGKDDPLWVVLTDATKRGGKWNVAEFFETGRAEISDALRQLESLNVKPARGKALDFGCGVGRISQALAEEFDEVHGVDISPSMIEHAGRFNRRNESCMFHVNTADDLRLFGTDEFDFVYSNIALQHIEPQYAKRYVREFFRVLRPGGVAVFQLLEPTLRRRLFPQFLVDRYREFKFKGAPYFGMFGVREREVVGIIEEEHGRILSLTRNRSPDLSWRWISLRFVVEKAAPGKSERA